MDNKLKKPRVYLTEQQKHEVYLLVLSGKNQYTVADMYNISQFQVSRVYTTLLHKNRGKGIETVEVMGREFETHHANINEDKPAIQPFNNYGMTTCNECGKLTSIDNPCHQQILTIKTAA